MFIAETDEEIMKYAGGHGVTDHVFKKDLLTPGLQLKIKSHIRRS